MSWFGHKHNWTDWLIVDQGDTYNAWREKVGWFTVQQRHCLTCGKTQVEDQCHRPGKRVSTQLNRAPRKDGVPA